MKKYLNFREYEKLKERIFGYVTSNLYKPVRTKSGWVMSKDTAKVFMFREIFTGLGLGFTDSSGLYRQEEDAKTARIIRNLWLKEKKYELACRMIIAWRFSRQGTVVIEYKTGEKTAINKGSSGDNFLSECFTVNELKSIEGD